MKIFFTYQGIEDKYFYELNVSSSLTVEELLKFEQIREIVDQLSHKLVVIKKIGGKKHIQHMLELKI